jgi:hypothetical protein
MSALGQKQTYAVQKGMSALPPIATAKADFTQTVMSALPPKADMCSATRDVRFGPKADSCGAAKRSLFDHSVSAGDQGSRHYDAQRFGELHIDRHLEFGWRLHRQVGWLLAF